MSMSMKSQCLWIWPQNFKFQVSFVYILQRKQFWFQNMTDSQKCLRRYLVWEILSIFCGLIRMYEFKFSTTGQGCTGDYLLKCFWQQVRSSEHIFFRNLNQEGISTICVCKKFELRGGKTVPKFRHLGSKIQNTLIKKRLHENLFWMLTNLTSRDSCWSLVLLF